MKLILTFGFSIFENEKRKNEKRKILLTKKEKEITPKTTTCIYIKHMNQDQVSPFLSPCFHAHRVGMS